MKVELTDVSETKKTLTVEVPQDVVESEISRITQRYARAARLPGFRPGKAPIQVVRRKFKDEILHDVAHDLVPRVVGDALRDKGVNPVDTPKVRDLQLEEGKPLTFTAAIETAPFVDPGDLTTLTVTRPEMPVTEDDVDQALSRLRDRLARMEPVEDRAAEPGDTVVMHLARRRLTGPQGAEITPEEPERHENVSAEIGAAANPPGFDEALVGVTAGQKKTFEVTFPSEYEVEEMAGARVEYDVEVTGLRRRVLPTLDDEFAKDLGEFQTLADLRGRIRQDLEQDADRERTRRMRQQLLEQLAARMTGEVPEGMVAREVDRRVEEFARRLMDQGVDPRQAAINWEEFRAQQQEPAVATVKSVLVLDKLAEREGLEVSEEELDADISGYATRAGRSLAEVKAQLAQQDQLVQIRVGLLREKAVAHALSRATIAGA
ncbi:trigger factor [Luteitalea sp. TBR-22]|uniref:trigger factor n=1 Tax=Luteitalea sp. TBR-22 TaxID=2802971 RepID=UPI001EF70473|nr:trigger factor [Luteitalea sp. TBR-22]